MVDVQRKPLTVSGKTTVVLKFDDVDKVHTTNMYVVEELITDLVIGRDFMSQNNCLVIFEQAETALKEVAETVVHSGAIFTLKPTNNIIIGTNTIRTQDSI